MSLLWVNGGILFDASAGIVTDCDTGGCCDTLVNVAVECASGCEVGIYYYGDGTETGVFSIGDKCYTPLASGIAYNGDNVKIPESWFSSCSECVTSVKPDNVCNTCYIEDVGACGTVEDTCVTHCDVGFPKASAVFHQYQYTREYNYETFYAYCDPPCQQYTYSSTYICSHVLLAVRDGVKLSIRYSYYHYKKQGTEPPPTGGCVSVDQEYTSETVDDLSDYLTNSILLCDRNDWLFYPNMGTCTKPSTPVCNDTLRRIDIGDFSDPNIWSIDIEFFEDVSSITCTSQSWKFNYSRIYTASNYNISLDITCPPTSLIENESAIGYWSRVCEPTVCLSVQGGTYDSEETSDTDCGLYALDCNTGDKITYLQSDVFYNGSDPGSGLPWAIKYQNNVYLITNVPSLEDPVGPVELVFAEACIQGISVLVKCSTYPDYDPTTDPNPPAEYCHDCPGSLHILKNTLIAANSGSPIAEGYIFDLSFPDGRHACYTYVKDINFSLDINLDATPIDIISSCDECAARPVPAGRMVSCNDSTVILYVAADILDSYGGTGSAFSIRGECMYRASDTTAVVDIDNLDDIAGQYEDCATCQVEIESVLVRCCGNPPFNLDWPCSIYISQYEWDEYRDQGRLPGQPSSPLGTSGIVMILLPSERAICYDFMNNVTEHVRAAPTKTMGEIYANGSELADCTNGNVCWGGRVGGGVGPPSGGV